MGFIFKSVFWLGLVYSAMPLGELPSTDARAILCSSPALPDRLKSMDAAYRAAITTGCAAAMVSQAETQPIPKATAAAGATETAKRPSNHSLIGADRDVPWFGGSRAISPGRRQKQS